MTKSDVVWLAVTLILVWVASYTSYANGYKAGLQHAMEMSE